MKRDELRDDQLQIRVNGELKAKFLEAVAYNDDGSGADVLNEAMKKYVKRYEREQRAKKNNPSA